MTRSSAGARPQFQRKGLHILTNLRRSVIGQGCVFVAEHVIPSPADPHFARLFDIHLLCTGIGRERTSEEYAELLAASGWRHTGTQRPSDGMISVAAGMAA